MGELMIVQGKNNSPELLQLDHQIKSVKRQLKSNQRSYWSPDISLSGQLSRVLQEDPVLANSSEGESDWQISLNFTLPFFQGGSRRSHVRQSQYQLSQLELQREAIEDSVELSVRQNLHAVEASYPSIELAGKAAEAARKNLQLVQDNYSKGTVSIIELIDARDSSLNASQNANNAVYDFLIDLMNLQRSTAGFDFFLDAQQMQRSIEQIRYYISTP